MRWTSIVAPTLLSVLSAQAEPAVGGGLDLRAGPAKDPFSHADFGGTPDLEVPVEVGLTRGEVEDLLAQMGSSQREDRLEASRRLSEESVGAEQVLREVLWQGVAATNRQLRSAVQRAARREGGLLEGLSSMDPAEDPGVKGAARIAALLEALDGLDTLAAYKVLMEFAPRHAGVFRREIGEMITAHGLSALPALVYGRGAEDKEVRMFAVAWIRDMGDPRLSEQVGIKNPRRLAQLLEAYASVNELGAIDVTLAMTNHDSLFVRAAARECLERFGVNVKWPARRLYENTLGAEPPEELDTPQILEALYRRFDQKRLEKMNDLFTEGRRAWQRGDYARMSEKFRRILFLQPMYPRRGEMALGFFLAGEKLEDEGDLEGASNAYRLAVRVAEPGSEKAQKAEARLKWLRAEALLKGGIADVEMYRFVVEADPENQEAAARLSALEGRALPWGELLLKSAGIGLVLFILSLLVWGRILATRRRHI